MTEKESESLEYRQQEVNSSRKTIIEFANEFNICVDEVRAYLEDLNFSLTRDQTISDAIQKHILTIHKNPSSPEAIALKEHKKEKLDAMIRKQKIDKLRLKFNLNSEALKPIEQQYKVIKPDRHISSAVKMAVWRRDYGKCIECGSNEKLEYDHIIPVSKGGSNTERNIQILCEKCNRKKSSNIQ